MLTTGTKRDILISERGKEEETMVTFFTNGKDFAISTKEGIKIRSEAMYNCLMYQYELMGWEKEVFEGITHFFP